MSDTIAMYRSIGARFAGVVCLTAVIVAGSGYLAGRSILGQVAALADDPAEINALAEGQRALVELHRERVQRVAPLLKACAARPSGEPCEVAGVDVQRTTLPPDAGVEPGWRTEQEYVLVSEASVDRFLLGWESLRNRHTTVGDVIAIKEHVTTLLPSLTDSFLKVFAGALAAGIVLGLLVTFVLSRRFSARVKGLVAYTRRIAAGDRAPAPDDARGRDEVGVLAEAMHVMAQDLEEARQRLILSEKMQSWQNVARKVAHEIKNPLTPISLVADELKRRAAAASGDLQETLAEAGRILKEETESLGRMVKEFSAFARLPDPDLKAGDLGELVADFVARNATETGPQFIVEAKTGTYPVVFDRGMIVQVLHNLVNNARLAKAPARLTVRFALHRLGTAAILDVIDDASGVPEALRTTLFDAYVTTRSTGDGEKGMGLGLTISRKIAVDHGGALNLHKTGPEGSCFRLNLPLAKFEAKA